MKLAVCGSSMNSVLPRNTWPPAIIERQMADLRPYFKPPSQPSKKAGNWQR